ncbi:MAG: hypothetical protein K0B16_19260, partial [Burkholderiaceae bacterium]|nr:hypothetical protein [Burkholderiaceae bacterium]
MDLLFIKGAKVSEPGRRAPDRRCVDGMARSGWNAAHCFKRGRLFIDALDDLFDPAADRAILLRAEHSDLAGSQFRRQRWWAMFFEALDAFLNALQPIEGTLQTVLCGTSDRGTGWFFTVLEFCIQGAANETGIGGFRVAQLTCFMDSFTRQP